MVLDNKKTFPPVWPPPTWISSQPTKMQVKTMVKAAVLQFCLNKIRAKADALTSLQYLKTRFMGLTKCHPMFTSCGSSPWEVEKATTLISIRKV